MHSHLFCYAARFNDAIFFLIFIYWRKWNEVKIVPAEEQDGRLLFCSNLKCQFSFVLFSFALMPKKHLLSTSKKFLCSFVFTAISFCLCIKKSLMRRRLFFYSKLLLLLSDPIFAYLILVLKLFFFFAFIIRFWKIL